VIDASDAGFAAGRTAGLIHAPTASLDDRHGALLRRELGTLSPVMQAQVQQRLRELFELG